MGSNSVPSNSNIDRGTTAARPTAPSVGTPYFNGSTAELQVYTAAGWAAVNAVPFPVNTVAFTNTGGANQYSGTAGTGNISFITGVGGGTPTSYVVTPSPTTSPATFSSASSPIAVTGLTPGQLYTFPVVATNNYGVSASASTTGTPTTKPAAPTLNSVVQSATSFSLSFSNNQTGGSAITSMSITSSPSVSLSYSGTTSPMTISGSFTSGQAYTFSVSAVNANGTGTAAQITSSPYAGPATIGYAMGGANNSQTSVATFSANVNKYTMSNDTNSNLAGTMPAAKGYAVSLKTRTPTGSVYAIGSFQFAQGNSIYKLNLSTEATSSLAGTIQTSTITGGFANSDNGSTSGISGQGTSGSAISKLTYATDSVSALATFPYSAGSLEQYLDGDGIHSWVFHHTGTVGSASYSGYKHTVSGDTWSTSSAPFMTSASVAPWSYGSPGYGDTVYGYVATQGSTSAPNGIGRFTYSTVTWAAQVSNYSMSQYTLGSYNMQTMYAAYSSGNSSGYLAGGNNFNFIYPLNATYKHNISAATVSQIASNYTNMGGTCGGANGV